MNLTLGISCNYYIRLCCIGNLLRQFIVCPIVLYPRFSRALLRNCLLGVESSTIKSLFPLIFAVAPILPVSFSGAAGLGRKKKNVLPCPSSLSTWIVPPWASTIFFEMLRPNPFRRAFHTVGPLSCRTHQISFFLFRINTLTCIRNKNPYPVVHVLNPPVILP